MATRRVMPGASVLLLSVLLVGCGFLDDDSAFPESCSEALDAGVEAVNTRDQILDELIDGTDVDPNDLATITSRSAEVQQLVDTTVSDLEAQADRQVQEYNRLWDRCRRQADGLPRACSQAFTRSAELHDAITQAGNVRLEWWITQLERAQAQLSGDVAGANAAVAEVDRLTARYNRLFDRIETLGVQRNESFDACDAAL